VDGRHESEEDTRGRGEEQSKEENAPAEGEVESYRVLKRRHEGGSHVAQRRGEDDSGGAAEERQQKAFGEELANEPGAAGTESRTHRDLMLARGGAGEQQTGDIHAGDEQHDPDHRHQHVQGLREARAQEGQTAAGGFEQDCRALAMSAGFHPGAGLSGEAGGRLLLSHAVRETCHHPAECRFVAGLRGRERRTESGDGHIDPGADERAEELRRRDADDGEGMSVDEESAPEDGGIAGEPPFPVPIADDSDAGIAGDEGASERWIYAEHAEVAVRRGEHIGDFALAGDEHVGPREAEEGRDAGEQASVAFQLAEQPIRDVADLFGTARAGLGERYETMRVADGQVAEKHGIEEAEDRGVGADAESEREHDYAGETGRAAKRSGGVAQVLRELVEDREAAAVAVTFAGGPGAAVAD
jgi:hypothetical protein